VVIQIDEYAKTAKIQFRNDYYDTEPVTGIDQWLDSYFQKVNPENKKDYSQANIGYETSSDDFFKYLNIDPKILDICKIMHLPSYGAIAQYIYNSTNKQILKNTIFISDYSNTQYICFFGPVLEDEDYYPKKVNNFIPIRNNPASTELDIEFKIKPAPMKIVDLPVHPSENDLTSDPVYYLRTQMPTLETVPYIYANFDIQKIVEGETNIDQTINDLFVCFFQGDRMIYEPDMEYATSYRKVNYPMPFVDFLYEFNALGERKINENNLSLRLTDRFKQLYEQTVSMDTTREYTFKFIAPQKLNSKSLFIFGNKKFACKEIRYSITPNGVDPIVEGVFYPVN